MATANNSSVAQYPRPQQKSLTSMNVSSDVSNGPSPYLHRMTSDTSAATSEYRMSTDAATAAMIMSLNYTSYHHQPRPIILPPPPPYEAKRDRGI